MHDSDAPSFRHRLEYAAVFAVTAAVGLLPQRVALAGGTLLGLAFYAIDAPHRRLTFRNLQRAFPDRSAAECRAIARSVFTHFGRLLIEVLRFSQLPKDEIRACVEFEGEERVREALELGRGVLFVAGHFGFWEIQGFAHTIALPPMAVVARRLDNPLLHVLLERARTRLGNSVIYRRGGLRRILRGLQANGIVAVMIDQHIQAADAVQIDYFGQPASTTTAVAALALRTGAVVIPVFALPLSGGRYRLVYEHPVSPPPPDAEDPIREFTQRCTDVLELYVRRHPDLWLWMHRRWRDVESAEARGMFPQGEAEPFEPSELEAPGDE
ncbi:MAG: lysophospholipid acyltransferase family protein [Vicinamibacterales bacterium]